MTISAKLFSILTISFRRRFLKVLAYIREADQASWWPCFLIDQICFSYFYRSPNEHFYHTILNSKASIFHIP